MKSVFVHIVTFNHADCIGRCLESLLSQKTAPAVASLRIRVFDNNSADSTAVIVERYKDRGVEFRQNRANSGFAAAHNQGAFMSLSGGFDIFIVLNPDVVLRPDALSALIEGMERNSDCEVATGLLLRADERIEPLNPPQIDSAGIVFTPQFRHFDRFQGKLLSEVSLKEERISGATGAYLAFTRQGIERLSLDVGGNEGLFSLYPALREGIAERYPLFDEAFFAYREDAELALRAQLLGVNYILIPSSVGFHRRLVTPEKRGLLSAEINRLGVRNRFLLQASSFSLRHHWRWILSGLLWRNLVVLLGVVLRERSSIRALPEFFILRERALARRRELLRRHARIRKSPPGSVAEDP